MSIHKRNFTMGNGVLSRVLELLNMKLSFHLDCEN